MDYTVHGIQARILEWVAFSFSRESSQPRDRTQVSRIAGGFFTSWASREVLVLLGFVLNASHYLLLVALVLWIQWKRESCGGWIISLPWPCDWFLEPVNMLLYMAFWLRSSGSSDRKHLFTMWETWVWSLGREVPWRRKRQPTPVLLPRKSHRWRSLVSTGSQRVGHNCMTSLFFFLLFLFSHQKQYPLKPEVLGKG